MKEGWELDGTQCANYIRISFPARAPILASLLPCSSVFRGSLEVSGGPSRVGLICAVGPAGGAISKVHKATGWVHGTSTHGGQEGRGWWLGTGRGHWGWASGGPSGSGGCGPDPGSASSASSSDAMPSSSRKTWRTVRVVRVRGPRLRGEGETRRQRLHEGSREKSDR